MSLYRKFPHALAVCFVFTLLAGNVAAQTTTTTTEANGRTRLETEMVVVPALPAIEDEPEVSSTAPVASSKFGPFERMILAAIDARLGSPYRMGAEGPYRYDCSGFVWSVFQSAGVSFERGSARTFWSRFAPVSDEEKFRFGTLVFFNHLHHVGIVADEDGFYHASTSRGVIYSPFNEYWTKRISGFRRVQVQPIQAQLAVSGR